MFSKFTRPLHFAALALTAFSTSFALAGAGSGGGSDGLTFTPIQSGKNDSVVTVPAELEDYGQLLITGELGSAEYKGRRAEAYLCTTDSQGAPTKAGCKDAGSIEIGTPTQLRSGTYVIHFSHSIYPKMIEVKKQMLTQFELRKIQVPVVTGKIRYSVYRDFSAADEQSKFLRDFFSGAGESCHWGYCSQTPIASQLATCEDSKYSKKTGAVSYCEDIKAAKSVLDFKKEIEFGADGKLTIQSINTDCFGNWYGGCTETAYMRTFDESSSDEYAIASQSDGGFVAVMPGTYKIVFTAEDGHTFVQQGVKVE